MAYDYAVKTDADFSGRLANIQDSFPMTLGELVNEACSAAGVTLSGTFPMASVSVDAFYADGITCRQILSWAAEIACRYVHCDSSGNLAFDWYTKVENYRITPTDGTVDGETYIYYKQDGLHYENYETEYLDNVAIVPNGADGVAYIYPTVDPDDVYATDPNSDGNVQIYNVTVTDDGEGNITFVSDIDAFSDGRGNITIRSQSEVKNLLRITNNLILGNVSVADIQSVAQNIYETLRATGIYRPARINLFPFNNPFHAGQIVKVTDIQGVSFVTPIMSETVQNEYVLLESTGNETYSTDNYGSTSNQLANLSSDIVKIEKLKVDWADIDTAVVGVLESHGMEDSAVVVSSNTVKEYYLSASNSSATGGSWSTTIPTWQIGKYIWTREKSTVVHADETTDVSYSPSQNGVYDVNLTTALSVSNAAQSVANSANAKEQLIYISKVSGTSSVVENTTWVTTSSDSQNTWTTKRPTYNSSYPVLFVATQRQTVSGTVTCTTPIKDDTTTVIDGGHITTGTIDASVVNVININADWINAGSILARYIKLYGLMGVYPSSASGSVGGYLGYTGGVAESGIAQGIAQVSEDYHTVCIVGTGGAFFGFHGDDELWVDGGDIKILTSNYPTAIILRQPDDSADPDAPVVPKYGYMVLKSDVRVHGTFRVSTDSGATYRQPMAEIAALQADMTDAQDDIAEINSFSSGILANGYIRYAKRMEIVTVEISYPAAGAITPTAGVWNDLATLPDGFRPPRDIDFVGVNNSASSSVSRAFRVTSGGIIRYWADASGETTTVRPAGIVSYIK